MTTEIEDLHIAIKTEFDFETKFVLIPQEPLIRPSDPERKGPRGPLYDVEELERQMLQYRTPTDLPADVPLAPVIHGPFVDGDKVSFVISAGPRHCRTCEGSGAETSRDVDGERTFMRPCPRCEGTGAQPSRLAGPDE